jgi:hypothetical protein
MTNTSIETVSPPNPEPAISAPQLSVLPDPTPKKKIRNGKIARLPYILRDMVNRMLRDHIPYDSIREALLEKGVHVTERNISNWKTHGGYEAWRLEQDRALETHLFQDNLTDHLRKIDGAQLPEVGLQLAATHLSAFFLKPETQQQLSTDPQKCSEAVSILCRVARQVHNLQKFRDETARNLSWKHDHERIKRANEKHIEITREVYSAREIDDKTITRRNYMPRDWNTLPEPLD